MSEGGRLLVVRFSPFTADACRANAGDTYADDVAQGLAGRYGVSVSGIVVRPGESEDSAIIRLREVVPLRGKTVAPVWADVLMGHGFCVVPDMPPELHHLVGVGDMTKMPDCDLLALIWNSTRRKCPTWKG